MWKMFGFFLFFALFFLDFVLTCLIFLFLNKNARKMPNLEKMPNENYPCQTLLKNAKFVKSGIEKCQLAALVDARDVFFQLDFYWNQLFDGRLEEEERKNKEAGERKFRKIAMVMVEGSGSHRRKRTLSQRRMDTKAKN